MLAYFVIGVELAILYTVFWYVFLREPKPYKLKGSSWGVYDDSLLEAGPALDIKRFAMFGGALSGNSSQALSEHGPDCSCKLDSSSQAANQSALYAEWNAGSVTASGQFAPYVPLTAGELIRSQSRGVERLGSSETNNAATPATYAPYNPAEQTRDKRKASAFLAKLGDKLNRINVKIP